MMKAAVAFSVLAAGEALTAVWNKHPTPILLQDTTNDGEKGMIPVKHKHFPVYMETYEDAKHKDNYVSLQIQQKGEWEGGGVQAFCNNFKKYGSKGNFLDVGGNIGGYSMPLASCLKQNNENSVLVTVEAGAENLKHLRSGMQRNKLDNMHLYAYAVGDKGMPDEVAFGDPEGSKQHGMSFVQHKDVKPSKGSYYVPATTLDAILHQDDAMKNVFAMKMDIEGFEYYAMKGAEEFFQKHKPCMISVELTHSKPSPDAARQFLKSHGYMYNSRGGTSMNSLYMVKDMEKCAAKL